MHRAEIPLLARHGHGGRQGERVRSLRDTGCSLLPPAGALTIAIGKALSISFDMTRNMTIAASDFTLKLRDWESNLARAKWMTERDSFHHITAHDVSEIRFARNGNFGVSVGVIFMRIL
jgi:hypothetical protein